MRENIRLAAIDLDGTLLKDDCTVSPETKRAVEAAAQKGFLIVPCTGRSYRNSRKVLEGIRGLSYFINANGASITDGRTGELLHTEAMKKEAARAVYQAVKKYRTFTEVYEGQDVYTDEESRQVIYDCGLIKEYCDQLLSTNLCMGELDRIFQREGIEIEKIHILVPDRKEKEKLMREIAEIPGIYPISVIPNNIEIVKQGWSKWKALEFLAGKLHIMPSEIMAIGDSSNDLEMLTYAGLSVAMGNAPDFIKAVCRRVTDTNENDGAAKALNDL